MLRTEFQNPFVLFLIPGGLFCFLTTRVDDYAKWSSSPVAVVVALKRPHATF